MLNEKDKLLENNYVLNKLKDARKIDKFTKNKTTCFVFAMVLGLITIISLYFISDYSKVFKVVVENNHYLKDEDVIDLASINDNYLLNSPTIIKKRLKKDALIDDATITLVDGNIININITEVKAIGYIYEDKTSKLLLINGERIEINEDNLYLIANVPLISGYSKEDLTTISKGFENIDYSLINEISEIHKYPISYDELQLEIIMRDGNVVFVSYEDLYLLEYYYSISSSIDETKGYACIYMDGFSDSAKISTCPWQNSEDSKNS